jgi:hypothetical protein
MFVMQLRKTIGILPLVIALTAHTQTSAPAATDKPAQASVSRVVLVLHTDLTSKGSKAGQQVKATTLQPVALSTGEKLPKGTLFLGSVVDVSKHTKEKPNGAVSLEFHQALPKGESPVSLIVKLVNLAPSGADDSARLPNSNGNMVSLASNSGGTAQLNYQNNDRIEDRGKSANTSTIDGVYLSPSTQSSGIVFALGDDVYLDHDVHLTVIMAPATAAK